MIDLKPFYLPTDECTRFHMDEPFVINGYKYATDGRICVRIPTTDPVIELRQRCVPRANELFLQFDFKNQNLAPFPRHSDKRADPEENCVMCGGNRFALVDCPCTEADGDGVCKLCKGSFEIITENPCNWCEGHGKAFEYMLVCGVTIHPYFQRLVAALPGARIFQNYRTLINAVPFIFDEGGQGLIMPIVR